LNTSPNSARRFHWSAGLLPAARRVLGTAAVLGLALGLAGGRAKAQEREPNAWPFYVVRPGNPGGPPAWSAVGPLFFREPSASSPGGWDSGFRPFWIRTRDDDGNLRSVLSLFPLFSYTADDNTYRWSLFDLYNRAGRRAGAAPTESLLEQRESNDIWPFWFSRQTADPDTTYRALFPVYGTIKHRLGYDRLFWSPFPLYLQTESHGVVTTHAPWPLLRWTEGAARGFGLWPLYGWQDGPGAASDRFVLWPFGFDHVTAPKPDAPAGTPPTRDHGVLPFYHRVTGPGLISEDYGWPFFGYTRRTLPENYVETRWFWPFFVQGHGDTQDVNRWSPFYTHSVVKGYDKTWVAWPVFRRATWTEDGLVQTKTQVVYFLYWSLEQRSAAHPKLASARLTHLWPLLSVWDNGAGHRQWQVLSPFEAMFTDNEKMRATWSPVFALFRSDQTAPGETHTALLWNAVTWSHSAAQSRREFHLGPLLSVITSPAGSRIALGEGLVGLRRPPGTNLWRPFLFDFPPLGGSSTAPPAS